jgi:hypothetical protein
MAELRQRISELELELARRLSLESKVARLSKFLAERESELANHDALIADAELRRNVAEEASQGLSTQLDARTRELFALKVHTDNVEARYLATSCSNIVLQADLTDAKAQRRIAEARREAEEAQSTAEEKLKAVEEKLKEVELGLQDAKADLQKAKLKSCELRKKSKHYKSKAAHYKSKADRFHSQILAFTKVRDRTWVNGFSWGFDSLKEFVLNLPTPSPNFAGLNYTDFMDVPEQAILELLEIGRDLILDVPDWVGEDAGTADEVTKPADLGASTKANKIEAPASQVSEEPNVDKI